MTENPEVSCEVLKVAYRQTKDGFAVTFVIHPQEVPRDVALAEIGTRYMMTLRELGDAE